MLGIYNVGSADKLQNLLKEYSILIIHVLCIQLQLCNL